MQHKTPNLLQDIYLEHLKVINGVNLTRREVDLIAFFISGRTTKKIAHFFSISPKTVENHAHNIMVKLNCNSREAIIDFVEKSDKLTVLRKYYTALLSQSKFDASLKAIAELLKTENPSFSIVDATQITSVSIFVSYLEFNLKQAGLRVSNENAEYLITLHLTSEGESRDICVLCSRPGAQETIEVKIEQKLLNLNDPKVYFLFVLSLLKTLFPL
jgi:DNA-binding CsgD family transcriptional regulator